MGSTNRASTSFSALLTGIAAPTTAAATTVAELSKATGIDLTYAYSSAGLKALGYNKVMQETTQAIHDVTGNTGLQKTMLADYSDTLLKSHVSQATYTLDMTKYAATLGDSTQMLKAIFPNQQAWRAAIVLTDTGLTSQNANILKMHDVMSGQLNPTLTAFQIQQGTMAASMAKLSATFNDIVITIGSAFLPVVERMAGAVAPIIVAIGNWAREHQDLMAKLLGGIAVFGLLAGAITGISMVLGPLAVALGAVSLPVVALVAIVAALAFAWTHDFGGIQEKTAEVWAAIQPVLTELQTMVQGIADTFKNLGLGAALGVAWDDLKTVWGQILDWLTTSAFPALAAAFKQYAPVLWQWIQQETPVVLAAIGTMLSAVGAWLKDTGLPTVGRLLVAGASALWAWIKNPAGPDTLAQLGSWAAALGAWLKDTGLPTLGRLLAAGASALWAWIKDPAGPAALAQLGSWASALGAWLKDTGLPALGAALVVGAHFLWDWILDPAGPKALTELGNLVGALGTWIGAVGLPMLGKALVAGASALWAWIEDPAGPAAIAQLGSWASSLGAWLKDTGLPTLARALVAGASALWAWIKDPALPAALHDLIGFMQALGAWFQVTGLPLLAQVLKDGAHALWDWIVGAAPQVLAAANTFGSDVHNDITGVMADAGTWLVDAGGRIIGGLIDGITGKLGDLKSKLGDITSLIPSWKGPLDADSQLLYPAGSAILGGLIAGIDSQQSALQAKLRPPSRTSSSRQSPPRWTCPLAAASRPRLRAWVRRSPRAWARAWTALKETRRALPSASAEAW